MKNEFSYSRGQGGISIRFFGGDIKRLAAEIGFLVHSIYSALYRQKPKAAAAFRHYVIEDMTMPGMPTWTISERSPEGVEIVIAVPGSQEGQARKNSSTKTRTEEPQLKPTAK